MRVNYHFHSRCSFDAEYPLTEMCRAAGPLRYLCLTDHCDLIDEYGKPDDSWSWAAEDAELQAARAAFPELSIRRGIELGQAILRPDAAEKVLSDPDIDFVLGSMHNCLAGEDFYWLKYESMEQCRALLEEYLGVLLALSRTDRFDSLAHLTYPVRYMKKAGFEMDLRPFYALIREILQSLVERGKALELNTSGWRQGLGLPLPDEEILKMYKAAGGELLTIGTDAHEPGHMTDGLERGADLLEKLGFRYVTLYEKRRPIQIKLEDVR